MSRLKSQSPQKEQNAESCLHLVLRDSKRALETCLKAVAPGDEVVLMSSAVLFLAESEIPPLSDLSCDVFLHLADVEAHGLVTMADARAFMQINDRQLVDLVCRHRHCLSWK